MMKTVTKQAHKVVMALDSREASHYNARALRSLLATAGDAQVAQLVEHATENRSVGGSIPPLGTST